MLAVYQNRFLETALAVNALKFGEFTLKSGRKSPYFFNAGAFADGQSLAVMAQAYAAVIKQILSEGLKVDLLFGPAYKGIPLVAAVATVLSLQEGIHLPWAFNRKEEKAHGEGGMLVGSDVRGKKVLILDDVLTAGTAVRASLQLLTAQGAEPIGLVVALDRQEKIGDSDLSALEHIRQERNLHTRAIVGLSDLLRFVQDKEEYCSCLADLEAYRQAYGA